LKILESSVPSRLKSPPILKVDGIIRNGLITGHSQCGSYRPLLCVASRGKYSIPDVLQSSTIPEMRNYTARPPDYIEENPDDPYYPDAIEEYFARPRVYENYTYFKYFKYCQISKKRMTKKDGFRDGILQDQLGYWIYKRNKPILVQSNYHRLCDGESFFFTQLPLEV
jgi:hypothetical protein